MFDYSDDPDIINFINDNDRIYDRIAKAQAPKVNNSTIPEEAIFLIKQKRIIDLTIEEKKIILPILQMEVKNNN